MTPAKTDTTIPTISRVCPDGTMVELLYDADTATTALAVCAPDGSITVEAQVDLPTGERLIPYAATNNLLTSGCVLLPSAVGECVSKAELIGDIKAFIHRHVDLPELYEDIAVHYVLLTWVHDAFNELGYLRFLGMPGSGKTRRLLAIGSLCYKPFFASGASTVSPIFHVLDAFGGTLILDEADLRFSDATADLTKILNNGTMKGLPVLRTMTNRYRELNPQAFKVFGPKLVAMRAPFADDALESRFITESTGNAPLRPDIDIHLSDTMKSDALLLRNKLLAWRFQARHAVGPDPRRLVDGLSPRGNQSALALLSLIDDEPLRTKIADDLVACEARVTTKRAASADATMVKVLRLMFRVAPTPYLTLADITAQFNDAMAEHGAAPIESKATGWLVRGKLGLVTTKTRGVYVIPQSERGKIDALADRFGLPAEMVIAAPEIAALGFLARSAKISA
ncbi:hypothetical protein [Sphingomonas sp. SUN039]|uniref:hypothetical protein n=1 Tax=Sphingomonas sp. SUN039 TaxID=2937787 RepID=UPI002164B800|nr:hypothetical protein [Sphingomonas sp. SUN039]UVO53065.1 hypothetical protein M0209_02620 [Sphingomonas sp. SUN039]